MIVALLSKSEVSVRVIASQAGPSDEPTFRYLKCIYISINEQYTRDIYLNSLIRDTQFHMYTTFILI